MGALSKRTVLVEYISVSWALPMSLWIDAWVFLQCVSLQSCLQSVVKNSHACFTSSGDGPMTFGSFGHVLMIHVFAISAIASRKISTRA